MIIYTYILLTVHLLLILFSDEPKSQFGSLLIYSPFYLRILGVI